MLENVRIGQSATKSNKYIVYKLTNSINGKIYIGITCRSVSDRWSEHKKRAREGVRNSRLYAAIRKYGPEAFAREVVVTANSDEEVRNLERRYIQEFNSFNAGYNSNLGGHGLLEIPEHVRIKIGSAQKGKYIPDATRMRMSQAKLGDSRCSLNFGDHTKSGHLNPRSKSFRFRFPDGSERVIKGLREFCRKNGLHLAHINARGHSKGYVLLERLND